MKGFHRLDPKIEREPLLWYNHRLAVRYRYDYSICDTHYYRETLSGDVIKVEYHFKPKKRFEYHRVASLVSLVGVIGWFL